MEIQRSNRSSLGIFTKLGSVAALVALSLAPAAGASSAPITAPAPSYCAGFETLPGCSPAETNGTTETTASGSWSTESVAGMSVQLYTPTSAPALGDERALMINLHGCIQTSTNLKNGGNWQTVADEYGMVLAIPSAPNGGVILGCWDYYDANHSSTNPARHDDNLIDLATTLSTREPLNIDAEQIYISGLSSGGGQSMVMGCLAPQIFAGMGLNAGPTVGTTSGQIGSVASNPSTGKNVCTNFAGGNSASFETQLTSVVYGNNDTTVAPGYNTLNASIMADIYGATTQSTFALTGLSGSNTNGSATLYSDADGPRVSVIQNTGLGHNWPAGGGPGGSYISTNSINYPAYLTGFFFENNRRAGVVEPTTEPTVDPTDPTTEPTEPTEPTIEPTEPTEPGLFCASATNAAHQAAGRATSYGVNPYNPYYAAGSLNYLGQGDATVTTLQETSEGSYLLVSNCG